MDLFDWSGAEHFEEWSWHMLEMTHSTRNSLLLVLSDTEPVVLLRGWDHTYTVPMGQAPSKEADLDVLMQPATLLLPHD